MVTERNPGSVANIKFVKNPFDGKRYLTKMFFMSNAQIRILVTSCKPILSLDGGHFKTLLWGKYKIIVTASINNNTSPR